VSVADYVVVDLAAENAELCERVALTENYRELAKAAIEQLVDRNRELETARRRIAALIAEVRALRGTVAA